MADLLQTITQPVRKVAARVAGVVEIPIGGTIGHEESPEEAHRRMLRSFRLKHYPHDPRLRSWSHLSNEKEDRQATPEEYEERLAMVIEELERFGLALAEPGDPEAFCVKWKGRPEIEWAERFMQDVAEGREVRHG